MARPVEKRLKGQTPVDQKDTYDPTVPDRKVTARVVDQTVEHYQSKDSQALLQFVDSYNRLQSRAAGFMEQKAVEQKEAGATSALRGEDKPETASESWIRGYETTEGQGAVHDYLALMSGLKSRMAQLAPNEYEAEKEAINKSFLNGASDNWIRGFVPGALDVETKMDAEYQGVQVEIVKNNHLTNVRKNTTVEAHRIMADPKIKDKSAAIRDWVTRAQKQAKDMKVSDRTEVAQHIIESLGPEAVRGANPDLMNFALVKDKDGVALIDRPELAKQIHSYINQALSKKASLDEVANQNKKKAQTAAKEAAQKSIIWSLQENDPVKREQAMDQAEAQIREHASILDPEDMESYLKQVRSLQLDKNWAKVADSEKYREYFNKAVMGQLAPEDWVTMNAFVPRDVYLSLAEVNARATTSAEEDSFGWRSVFNKNMASVTDRLNANPLVPGFMAEYGDQRRKVIEDTMYQNLWDFQEKNKGQKPGYSEIKQWRDEAEKNAEAIQSPIPIPKFSGVSKPTPTAGQRVVKGKSAGSGKAKASEELDINSTLLDELDDLDQL